MQKAFKHPSNRQIAKKCMFIEYYNNLTLDKC